MERTADYVRARERKHQKEIPTFISSPSSSRSLQCLAISRRPTAPSRGWHPPCQGHHICHCPHWGSPGSCVREQEDRDKRGFSSGCSATHSHVAAALVTVPILPPLAGHPHKHRLDESLRREVGAAEGGVGTKETHLKGRGRWTGGGGTKVGGQEGEGLMGCEGEGEGQRCVDGRGRD